MRSHRCDILAAFVDTAVEEDSHHRTTTETAARGTIAGSVGEDDRDVDEVQRNGVVFLCHLVKHGIVDGRLRIDWASLLDRVACLRYVVDNDIDNDIIESNMNSVVSEIFVNEGNNSK